MKGLTAIPRLEQLQEAYAFLQDPKENPSCEDLALYCQWSRFDSRLGEQLVDYFSRHWGKLSPVEFNEAMQKQIWPQTLGLLLEQTQILILKKQKTLFKHWKTCALSGIEPQSLGQYFIGTRAFAGELAFEDALFSTRPYLKWGFIGRESLLKKNIPLKSVTLLPPGTRRALLRSLLQEKSRITLRDYLLALNHQVSMRQAELDLAAHPALHAVGNTRARFYRKKSRI